MDFKLFILLVLLKIVTAKISIKADVDKDGNINLIYSGEEVDVVDDGDIRQFNIGESSLKEAVRKHYGRRPNDVYVKSPTPWGDLYKSYNWEQVSRVLSIKSAKVKSNNKHPVIVLSHDFENFSNKPIKVNTGLTHTIQNTLTSTWSRNKEFTVSQEIGYDVNIIFAKVEGTTGFSFTTNWGVSETKEEAVTLGIVNGMETELQPGQTVTAVLSAYAGYIEIEVEHKVSLKGDVAVNYKKPWNGHHFWGPYVKDVMQSGGLNNEITTLETFRFSYHVDATLKVYDKATGKSL